MGRMLSQRGRFARSAGRVLALVLLLAVAWAGGLVWFAETIPRRELAPDSPEAQRHTDAIVVLTGGSERLAAGLDLLARGRAEKLFVSGVYQGVDVQELLRLSRQAPGELECCIVLGYAADNTVGNAVETAWWMREQGYASMRLVTANYHMRRSLLEFGMVLPDVEVVPHPVAPDNVRLAEWWQWPGTANLIISEYNKYLITLLRFSLEKLFES